MTAASPNNYGTIIREDGEVWDVRGSAGVTSCNIYLFETGTSSTLRMMMWWWFTDLNFYKFLFWHYSVSILYCLSISSKSIHRQLMLTMSLSWCVSKLILQSVRARVCSPLPQIHLNNLGNTRRSRNDDLIPRETVCTPVSYTHLSPCLTYLKNCVHLFFQVDSMQ